MKTNKRMRKYRNKNTENWRKIRLNIFFTDESIYDCAIGVDILKKYLKMRQIRHCININIPKGVEYSKFVNFCCTNHTPGEFPAVITPHTYAQKKRKVAHYFCKSIKSLEKTKSLD